MRKPVTALGVGLLLLAVGWWLTKGAQRATEPQRSIASSSSVAPADEPATEIETVRSPIVDRAPPLPTVDPVPPDPASALLEEFVWHARVVDGARWDPLAEASFLRIDGEAVLDEYSASWTAVPPDGVVSLRLPAEGAAIAFKAPGFALAFVAAMAGHEQRSNAEIVPLQRSATLLVHVRDRRTDRNLPVSVRVHARASSLFEDARWTFATREVYWPGESEAEGGTLFSDLPPNVELTLDVAGDDEPLHRETLILRPRDQRERNIQLGDGSTIAGLATTPEGRPVPGLQVWLVRDLTASLYFEPHEEVDQRAYTDERGEFRFEEVSTGLWSVGLAAIPRAGEPGAGAEPIVAEAVVLRAPPEDGVVSVTLTCSSGESIRGRVLDSAGNPAPGAFIAVANESRRCRNTRADDHGEFETGPLVSGEYRLSAETFSFSAEAHSSLDRRSDWVPARAGDVDAVLRTLPGGGISAVVRDEQGEPAAGAVVYLVSTEAIWNGRSNCDTDSTGRIMVEGVAPGQFALLATRGSCVGLQQVTVSIGEKPEVPGPRLEPGLQLTIDRPRVRRSLGHRARYQGWIVSEGFFPPEIDGPATAEWIVVPAGEVVVELFDPRSDAIVERKTVTGRPGQELRVVFDVQDPEPR